ncbi:MAG: Clp protease ClpP [Melioribacter sp.]|nr:Clp protease ClpP [Melioribacter sp.]
MEKFNISGIIGFDFTSKDLSDFLLANPDKEIYLTINSPGGSVYEAIAIYNLIKNHSKPVTIEILGLAASAASFITTAANKVLINPNSVYMLHNAWLVSIGDHNKLRDDADYIEKISNLLVTSYSNKSKKSVEEIKKLMDAETFLFGNEIIDYGFADELINSEENKIDEESKTILIENAKNQFSQIPRDLFENDLLKAAALINHSENNSVPILSDDDIKLIEEAITDANDSPDSKQAQKNDDLIYDAIINIYALLNRLSNKLDSLNNKVNDSKLDFLVFENKFTSNLPDDLIDEINADLIKSNKIIPAQAKLIKELFDAIQNKEINIATFVELVFEKLIAILDAKPNSNLLQEFATKPDLENQEEETFSFAIVDQKSREIHRKILQIMKEKKVSYLHAANLLLTNK